MRILYFHQHFCTPRGGAGIRSYEMARKLVSCGHQVTMVCGAFAGANTGLDHDFRRGSRRGLVDGIDVIEFDLSYSNNDGLLKRAWLFALFALRSVKVALFHKSDLIFATSTPLTAGIPGIVARWLKGTPFVFEVRDLWPELPREMKVVTNPIVLKLLGALEWASYKSAHRLVGLSPGIVEGIKRLGIDESKVALIPNGCDIDIFGSVSSLKRPEGVLDTDFVAIFTGTHGVANGLDAVLDCAAVLKSQGDSRIKFVLVGQGKLKPGLVERAKEEGLTNVIFHDLVPKDELAELLAGADIGLQILANIPAFYYGTSPNKFFDYLSAGLPVLTNYPGWVADLVTEYEIGYAVPAEDAQAFAVALADAEEDPPKLASMGENSTLLAKREYSREDLAGQFVEWVCEAVTKK